MHTQSAADVCQLRSQLTLAHQKAESAFERAFDLQQAGAPADRVDAALAEVNRWQDNVRLLSERLAQQSLLH